MHQSQGTQCPRLLPYLAGGAFRAGDPLLYMKSYKAWLQRLADGGIDAKILAVGYPLAPENRWPVPVQGVVEAYQWLVKQQGGSDNIILGRCGVVDVIFNESSCLGVSKVAGTGCHDSRVPRNRITWC